jgi:isopentenyl-diphosphate delta-isomerase
MENGIVENEICPVFSSLAVGHLTPNSAEVEAYSWEPWAQFCADVTAGRRIVSPWCERQLSLLMELGHPHDWPEASFELLPTAAQRLATLKPDDVVLDKSSLARVLR